MPAAMPNVPGSPLGLRDGNHSDDVFPNFFWAVSVSRILLIRFL
jgi:hypothetical protein